MKHLYGSNYNFYETFIRVLIIIFMKHLYGWINGGKNNIKQKKKKKKKTKKKKKKKKKNEGSLYLLV